MQINAERVTALRKKSSWSQDELATAAGLNLRTVQRVENSGSASLQTLKAIAAALEVDLDEFKVHPEKVMAKYEYKTLVLPFKMGLFKQGLPDIASALNAEGSEGWQLKQIMLPSSQLGTSDSVVAVLERVLGQQTTLV
jgi:transcriptional regulator with XRE-family HTH domain